MAETQVASISQLVALGSARPAPDTLRALYEEVFRMYGTRALWSSRAIENPTVADTLAITESLRVERGVAERRLAEQIVTGCRAAL